MKLPTRSTEQQLTLQPTSTADVVCCDCDSDGCCICCFYCAAPHSLNVFRYLFSFFLAGRRRSVRCQNCSFVVFHAKNRSTPPTPTLALTSPRDKRLAQNNNKKKQPGHSYAFLLLANIQMQFMSSSPLLCIYDVSLAMAVVAAVAAINL